MDSEKLTHNKGNIEFQDFRTLDMNSLTMILDWRNADDIRQFMVNAEVIPLDEHLSFVEGLKSKPFSNYYLAIRKRLPLGVVSIHRSASDPSIAEWGYYLNPEYKGFGFGLELGFESLALFFDFFNITRLNGFVKSMNKENLDIQDVLSFKKTSENDGLIQFTLSLDDYNELPKQFKTFKRSLVYGR